MIENARVLATSRDVELSLTAPETAACSLDQPTVTRALANLVDNAIRHAPAGSAVEVFVEVEIEVGDDEARVVVTDHGPGILAEERERILERFWRGRRETPGTGLGLPIARQIALAHGGSLSVRSPGPAGDGCACELRLRR